MIKYLIALLLVTTNLHAENWFCTEESSERVGAEIHACGVGFGATERDARESAFAGAKFEFDDICAASSDCVNHAVTVEPKRTNCEKRNSTYTCYRMVVYIIGKEDIKTETNTYDVHKYTNDLIQANLKSQQAIIHDTFFSSRE